MVQAHHVFCLTITRSESLDSRTTFFENSRIIPRNVLQTHIGETMEKNFSPGSTWELTTDANCIPKGVYTLVERVDELLIFSVGTTIQFGLSADYYKGSLRQVIPKQRGMTSPLDFMRHYMRLLSSPTRTCSDIRGMTLCAIHPALAKKFRPIKALRRSRSVIH